MARKLARLVVLMACTLGVLVPAVPASAHGSCFISGDVFYRSSFFGDVGGNVARVCQDGHARLRMVFWVEKKLASGWNQVSDTRIAECLQCKTQNRWVYAEDICDFGENDWYRVHVEVAYVFNSSGQNVTSSHPHSPTPPWNSPAKAVC
jgi:hypothetical protein